VRALLLGLAVIALHHRWALRRPPPSSRFALVLTLSGEKDCRVALRRRCPLTLSHSSCQFALALTLWAVRALFGEDCREELPTSSIFHGHPPC
jgi:hypothetical protein